MSQYSHTDNFNELGGKNYLLSIAVDDYVHYNKLNNAVKDVQEITDILTSLYQFSEQDIFTLFNEEATEDGIDEMFLHLVDLITEKDNLLIFFSGHGYFRENVKEGYWVPADGRKDKVSDYISNANLIRYLQNINAHHLLLIVDSCFSGTLVEQLRGESGQADQPSRRVFASGRAEMVSDGIPGENSPFARGIINFLKDNSSTKENSTSSLIDAVKSFVRRKVNQEPIEGRLRDFVDNRGEFFFQRKFNEEDLWKTVLAKGQLEDYEQYLTVFPEGVYSRMAQDQLARQRAEIAWAQACANDRIYDYEDFILLFPNSDLRNRAQAKIELIQKAEEVRRQTEEDRITRITEQQQREEELIQFRSDYREKYILAKQAMEQEDYRRARNLLYECERLYQEDQEGFDPKLAVILKTRKVCTDQLLYLEYSKDGHRAFKIKDYNTAIHLFTKALAIKPSEDIKKLLRAATSLGQASNSVSVSKGSARSERTDAKREGIIVQPGATMNRGEQAAKKPTSGQRKPLTSAANAQVPGVKPTAGSRRSISIQKKVQEPTEKRTHVMVNQLEEPDYTFLKIGLAIIVYFILAKWVFAFF